MGRWGGADPSDRTLKKVIKKRRHGHLREDGSIEVSAAVTRKRPAAAAKRPAAADGDAQDSDAPTEHDPPEGALGDETEQVKRVKRDEAVDEAVPAITLKRRKDKTCLQATFNTADVAQVLLLDPAKFAEPIPEVVEKILANEDFKRALATLSPGLSAHPQLHAVRAVARTVRALYLKG